MKSAASLARVELSPANVRDVDEMDGADSAIAAARSNGGLILAASSLAYVHRDAIVALGGPAQTTGSLLCSAFRHRWRPDFLRTLMLWNSTDGQPLTSTAS